MPPGIEDPDWRSLSFSDFEIVVPALEGEFEIPWTAIRLLSDDEFATHWARVAEEEASRIGQQLRILRKRKNLSSKEVAERAGIAPQSLSRIENGRHDVVFTTLKRILAAMGASLKDLAVLEEDEVPLQTVGELIKRLEDVGLRRDVIFRRVFPPELANRLSRASGDELRELLLEATGAISNVFGWSKQELLVGRQLSIDHSAAQYALFKTSVRTDEKHTTAYALFAHYVALLALQATEHLPSKQLPTSATDIRKAVIATYREMTLESLLLYLLDHGIPVVPLQDSGAFHGACWRVDDRSVVVLKQVTPYQARWLFDLAHEICHISRHLSNERDGIVEAVEISGRGEEPYEQEASDFASELLLYGRAGDLAEMCVGYSDGRMEFLKSAVIRVAASEQVPVDVLANYLAYRLSMQGENWWGTASGLQMTDPAPLEVAQSIFLGVADLNRLSPPDRELLLRAIGEPPGLAEL
jgi:transcriptional regulator with XRE-family HTH domain/Zn-dependent peptidase ImmA (M78 family)